MNLNDFLEVKIKHQALADHLYEKSIYPLLEKLCEKIPTQIDDGLLVANKENLKQDFQTLFENAVKELERKTKVDLDGNGEIA